MKYVYSYHAQNPLDMFLRFNFP